MQTNYNGSEIHRLKPMKEYDQAVFQRMYKICKPVIRNLVRQIDAKRFDLTPDIIQSYFGIKCYLYLISIMGPILKNI